MKRINLLLVILFIVITAFNPNAGKWLITPAEKAIAYNGDSIMSIMNSYKGDLDNNYYISDSAYEIVFKKLKGFDKMHLYNTNGKRVLMMPDDACGSPVLSPGFNTELALYEVVEADDLGDALKMFIPVSEVKELNKEYPTAILYWNRTMGQQSSDNVFAWEKAFKEKFQDRINIIKVNTDVHESWTEEKKEKYLALLDKILSAIAQKVSNYLALVIARCYD